MKKTTEKIIMGIDPGTKIMGFGIIKIENKLLSVLHYGVIHLKQYDNHALKLKKIYERLTELINQYAPDEMALEAPFYSKNPQVALKLGRAQGMAMATALAKEIPVSEYAPRKVKQAVTGNGASSKEQVAEMVKLLLGIHKDENIIIDATDALGVAICHHFESVKIVPTPQASPVSRTQSTKKTSWESFIKENPNRIK